MAAQIAECLAATLNSDTNTRVTAELKLAEYFASPGQFKSIGTLSVAFSYRRVRVASNRHRIGAIAINPSSRC